MDNISKQILETEEFFKKFSKNLNFLYFGKIFGKFNYCTALNFLIKFGQNRREPEKIIIG